MVKVITSERFERISEKIDKSLKLRLKKLIIKVLEDPQIGKPMRYSRKGTREVYVGSFRLSYAYNEKEDILEFLDIYHKDTQ